MLALLFNLDVPCLVDESLAYLRLSFFYYCATVPLTLVSAVYVVPNSTLVFEGHTHLTSGSRLRLSHVRFLVSLEETKPLAWISIHNEVLDATNLCRVGCGFGLLASLPRDQRSSTNSPAAQEIQPPARTPQRGSGR